MVVVKFFCYYCINGQVLVGNDQEWVLCIVVVVIVDVKKQVWQLFLGFLFCVIFYLFFSLDSNNVEDSVIVISYLVVYMYKFLGIIVVKLGMFGQRNE